MPKVGEAWYELDARDAGLVRALKSAEGKARSSGKGVEGAFGTNATKGFDSTGKAATKFGGTVDAVTAKTGRFGGVMKGVGQGILQGVGIAGFMGAAAGAAALVGAIGKSISAASDLNETISKVGVVFKGSSAEILEWGKSSAEAFGMSQNTALGAAAQYGNLFVALGLAEQKSSDMSMRLVELAGDLASFNNVDPTEALDALRSGLVGETEPLRRFGVNLNEATIAQKALELGLIRTTKEAITPAIKAQATYALILDQTKTAQGDFARTSDGLANRQRIAAAKVEDAFAKMGQALLPIAADIVPLLADAFAGLVTWLGEVIAGIGRFVAENKALFDTLGALASLIVNVLGMALGALAKGVSDAFGAVTTVIGAAFDVVKFVVAGIIGAVRNVMDIAAQIPGPWQESAAQVRDTLNEMQANVETWGQATTQTAADSAVNTATGFSTNLAAGAPAVAAAAETALTNPVAAAAEAGKTKAVAQARLTPGEMARGLLDQRFDVDAAMKSIADAQETTLSRTKEIAALEGFLTGKALRDALNDARPEVRAQAEAWKTEAEDRLFALRNGVAEIARRTGMSYGDALALQKKKIGQSAAAAVKDADAVFVTHSKQDSNGRRAGRTFADGIESQGSYLYNAVHRYLGKARVQLQALSPPKEGPLHFIDVWARNIGRTFGDEFESQGDYFRRAVQGFLQAGVSELREPTRQILPVQSVVERVYDQRLGGPILPEQRTVTIGAINVPVTFTGAAPSDPGAIRTLGRAIGEEVRLSLVRTPELFSLRGT